MAYARRDQARLGELTASFGKAVAERSVPGEVLQHHELIGLQTLLAKDPARAIAELKQANPLDPRSLFYLAQAIEAGGDAAGARDAYARVADFNALAFNLGLVRKKALEKAAPVAAAGRGR